MLISRIKGISSSIPIVSRVVTSEAGTYLKDERRKLGLGLGLGCCYEYDGCVHTNILCNMIEVALNIQHNPYLHMYISTYVHFTYNVPCLTLSGAHVTLHTPVSAYFFGSLITAIFEFSSLSLVLSVSNSVSEIMGFPLLYLVLYQKDRKTERDWLLLV